jgi:glycosyltransferase involved in cell wall biosynthesis
MKVLHLTTHLNIGGITTYILKLIKPLKKTGVETFVLSAGGECTPEFVQAGAQVFELPIRTKNELHPKLYRNLAPVVKIIREHKIDLLHAHTRVTQVMAHFLQRQTGIPVVTTCHGFYKWRLGRWILPAWGDRVIAISQGVGDHLRDYFKIDTAKMTIVNNGVDIEEIDAAFAKHQAADVKVAYGFNPSDPVIGIVARLVSDKGHDYLLRAVGMLRKKFPTIRLLIVGEGKHRRKLEQLTAELNLEPNVIFCGNVKDVTQPIAAMDIFAFPATWREGFGLSIVEAMACRKPVIVSNIWSLNTLIKSEVTGILIEPKQAVPLAEAIGDLLMDKPRARLIGDRGRQMVEENFSIGRMAQGIVSVYRGLAQSKGLTVNY